MIPTPSVARQALVIGASRGVGLGLARELTQRGWNVVATARDIARAAELNALAGPSGGRMSVIRFDLADRTAPTTMLRDWTAAAIDLLVINGGIWGPQHQSVSDATEQEVTALFETNAIGPARTARALLRLLAPGATIAFMSSRMGSIAENTSGGADLYRASKAAQNALAHGLVAEAEVRAKGIGVLSLHPGWVRTAMGGPQASIGIDESVRGMVDVLERPQVGGHRFVDYQGAAIAW